jgi:hypothetical protein
MVDLTTTPNWPAYLTAQAATLAAATTFGADSPEVRAAVIVQGTELETCLKEAEIEY